ncbi:MAG: hypothetical protein CMJ16_02135 [Peredibacter sp.]|nr:hypothetical protein [Peredibacter sp.]
MKKFVTYLLVCLSLTGTANAALLAGITGNPLIFNPMIPTVIAAAMVGGNASFKEGALVTLGTYGVFFLLDEESATIEVIQAGDDFDAMTMDYGLEESMAELVLANKEEINAAVNAAIAQLSSAPTAEEVKSAWKDQESFIGGEEVAKAYAEFGKAKANYIVKLAK